MYSLRLSFIVYRYCCIYYLYYLTASVRWTDGASLDCPRKETNEFAASSRVNPHKTIARIAPCRETEEKIRKLHNVTKNELNLYASAQWNYHTNRTEDTTEEAKTSSVRLFSYQKLLINAAENMSLEFDMSYEELLPLVYFTHDHGVFQLDLSDYNKAVNLKSKLKQVINKVTVCEYEKTNQSCDITTEELQFIMANSTDAAELKHYWKAWHNQTAFDVKTIYMKYIEVLNHMAKLNNISNEVAYYMRPYLMDECHLNVDRMYEGVIPLYAQLFSYTRKFIRDKFGAESVSADGPIPVHLLGSVLGQPWTNILESVSNEKMQYINRGSADKTPKRLFDQANRFFVSIGMGNVPKSVWSRSVFVSDGNFADCSPSSWNMYTDNDYRIKMCFQDTAEDVYTMHKQLGLVRYFMAYKKQPIAFQRPPDSAFAEGMLNALTLSVRYQDFIDRHNDSATSRRVYLLRMASKKVAILPFVYAAGLWHSNVFGALSAPKRMNDCWWGKRLKYEGVVPPINRGKDKCAKSNYKPFDPAASYNMLTELPHIRHFLGPIIEFQIFKSLCTVSGEYDPKNANTKHLYECNLRGYKKIGKIIKWAMSKGSSKKWQFLFQTIVGHRRLEVEPLLEYFQPLYDHLCVVNSEANEHIGWKTH